jgi:hypothetical protein
MQLYRVLVLVRGTLVHSQLVQEQLSKLKVRDTRRFAVAIHLTTLLASV